MQIINRYSSNQIEEKNAFLELLTNRGFNKCKTLGEIEKLFAADSGDVQDDDFDLTAALSEAAFVLPGDVWTLGRHRLICGDATDADTVKNLMDGRKANLVLTHGEFMNPYISIFLIFLKKCDA